MTDGLAPTRQRIESAAVQLFVEKGVAETTIKDLARVAGLSEGALYRHFASKEQLVWLLFERHYVEFGGKLLALAHAHSETHSKLAAMIQGFCRAHDENPLLFRFMLFVQHGQLAKLPAEACTPVDAMRTVLEHGVRVGDLPEQDVDLATAIVFGVVLEPAQFAAYGRGPSELVPIAQRLTAAAWAALTTP